MGLMLKHPGRRPTKARKAEGAGRATGVGEISGVNSKMQERDRVFKMQLCGWMGIAYLLLAMLAGCGGAASTPPPKISVSFGGGNSQTIGQGQSVTITATVANDPSGRGVSWTLAGPGSLSKQTSTSV